MPIYESTCQKCGLDFERLVMDRDEKVECPDCGANNPRKKLSVFARQTDSGPASVSGGSACGGCTASSCKGCSSAN